MNIRNTRDVLKARHFNFIVISHNNSLLATVLSLQKRLYNAGQIVCYNVSDSIYLPLKNQIIFLHRNMSAKRITYLLFNVVKVTMNLTETQQ